MGGAVACGHAEAARAAAALLRGGGNAFDAAMAAAFAACVAEPMFTSLGGGGFLLARTADGGEVLYDFFADTPGRGLGAAPEPHFEPMTVHFPASEQVFNIGLGSVAVPGTLAGLLHVHAARGRADLREVLAPAVALARDGVVLNAHQAYVIGLLRPINTLTPDGSALYAPDGRAPAPGERLRNPSLAAFLERLPGEGAAAFYAGAVARAVAEDMRAGGGLLTGEDLAAYRVRERAPLALDFAGHRVLTNPPPAFGGTLLAASLALHAGLGAPAAWGSAEHLVQLVAVMQEVERGRAGPPAGDAAASLRRVRRATGGTTHVSALDGEGNVASLSLSNGEGSGYVARGTGIMLNNMLGEDDLHPDGFHASPPGERIASMMSPTLVLRDGRTVLALGSGGSKRIRSAIAQVLLGVVAHGRALEASVRAPRVHWDGERVQVEPGFAEAAVAALARRWPVNRWPERNLYFGGVHAVAGAAPGAAGGMRAAADPRRQGAAVVVSG